MLKSIALFTGIIGLSLIGASLAYGLLAAKSKSKAFAWLIGVGVLLIIVSWVLFIMIDQSLELATSGGFGAVAAPSR